MCSEFIYNFCLKHFSLYEELGHILLEMYAGLRVKHPLFLVDMNEFSRQILEEYSNTKLHENPSSGSPVAQRADRHDEANNRFFATLRKRLKNEKSRRHQFCIHRRSDVSQMLSGQGVDLSSLLRRSEGV